jgi:PQQ-dependent catabolism-associated CXXCW motif protein
MRDRRRVLALLLALCGSAAAAQVPPEPEAYRLDDYRAPTPLTVAGREALDTEQARRLWEAGSALFVDVLPAPRRPEGLAPGAVWAPRPRRGIPGSFWLPDLGRGALNEELASWLRARLAAFADNDPKRVLVFYCLSDCWMGWNAAKRALEWGYVNALWYREGTDEWEAAGLPLAAHAPPEDMPR